MVAATAHVRARRIADSGGKASDGPQVAFDGDVPVKRGELAFPLSDFASGDAYAIEINLRRAPTKPLPERHAPTPIKTPQ